MILHGETGLYLTFSFTSSKMECNPLQLGVIQLYNCFTKQAPTVAATNEQKYKDNFFE